MQKALAVISICFLMLSKLAPVSVGIGANVPCNALQRLLPVVNRTYPIVYTRGLLAVTVELADISI
jgi:hypothetical protein